MNLTQKLVDLEGKPLENAELGKILGNILGTTKSDDPMRSWSLAQKIYQSETIDLNDSDREFVTKTVKANENYLPLVRGQILAILKENKN